MAEILPPLLSKSILLHQLFSISFSCMYPEYVFLWVFYVSWPASPGFPHYHIRSEDFCPHNDQLANLSLIRIFLLLLQSWYSDDVWDTFLMNCRRWCMKLWKVSKFTLLICQSLISVANGEVEKNPSELMLWGRLNPSDILVWFSQCCVSVLHRLSRFVVSLRSWATRHLHHEDQRPDSFLERIRGPELVEVSSRQSNIRSFLGIREQPGGVNG